MSSIAIDCHRLLSIAIDYHWLSFAVKQIVFDQLSINNPACNTARVSSARGRVLMPGSIATAFAREKCLELF